MKKPQSASDSTRRALMAEIAETWQQAFYGDICAMCALADIFEDARE
ncbi:MAG: hypothetical protein M5R36_08470 [Deltaproteobacteria bacterium]|nr:hypothetical protein [Deltaproteobacteria bacterium]